MLNQVILVGRLTKDLELIEGENGKKNCIIQLAVHRPYKNIDGEYEYDFIECELWNMVAENTSAYCHKGDIVGIKGRIERLENNDMKIIAEKVTFLSSKSKEINEEIEN